MHHFDVNFSKFWRKNMNSLYVNLERRIFSYKFSVQKTCIDYLKMHSECTILMQFLKKIPGEAPRTPTCGRGWPPPPPSPFRRFAPQWSLRLHWSLVPPPPRQWRFWIRPWLEIPDREKRGKERKGNFIIDLRCYKLLHCTQYRRTYHSSIPIGTLSIFIELYCRKAIAFG